MTDFKAGDRVAWTSSARGKTTRKEGEVIYVLPPGTKPAPHWIRNPGAARDHTSYIVEDGHRRFWPRVNGLERVAPIDFLGLTSCDFVGDSGCVDKDCEKCHGTTDGPSYDQGIATLEAELARIRPVYEAACAAVDADGPLLPWDRRRDPMCVAVDTSRGFTAEQAIEARLRASDEGTGSAECSCIDVPSRHLDDDGHLPRCEAKP